MKCSVCETRASVVIRESGAHGIATAWMVCYQHRDPFVQRLRHWAFKDEHGQPTRITVTLISGIAQ